eukprot:347986_1
MRASHCQILDKIHTFYRHCYDLGCKLSSYQRETLYTKHNNSKCHTPLFKNTRLMNMQKISTNQKTFQQLRHRGYKKYQPLISNNNNKYPDTDQKYSFGYPFMYGYCGEYDNIMHSIYVIPIYPKYASLKEELTMNDISTISIQQFNVEYQKGGIHFNSHYCRETLTDVVDYYTWSFSIQHILSLMIYCNFTQLQYKFSKTYRENNGKNHNEFYNLGKYLKISVKIFGTEIHKGNISQFYHGIGQKLLFPSYIGVDGVLIYCPLSTSSSFEVAMNFTNNNNGLIIQFG